MKTTEKYFYDIHCHLIDFSQPDFFIYVNELKNKLGEEAIRFLFSPDYIIDLKNKNAIEKVANLFNVMSHSQSEILEIIENDLDGKYLKTKKTKPIIQDNLINIRDFRFEKYCLSPLVMDFNVITDNYKDLYYDTHKTKKIDFYADLLIKNIKEFYKNNPNTKIELYPFLGINTAAYTIQEINSYLTKYFKNYTPNKRSTKDISKDPNSGSLFSGLKFYPPLGFDPWPEDEKEREKVELLYSFAEKNGIPITTHCDDGGYRVIDTELSWKYSSPERYIEVLKKYPELKLNFAHLGQQYYRSYGILKRIEWRQQIYKFMLEYPNVYADIAYNAVNPTFFPVISKELDALKKKDRDIITGRIMFGSDFNICLNKIKSYTDYIRTFEKSVLSDENIFKICHLNPEKFLFESKKSQLSDKKFIDIL